MSAPPRSYIPMPTYTNLNMPRRASPPRGIPDTPFKSSPRAAPYGGGSCRTSSSSSRLYVSRLETIPEESTTSGSSSPDLDIHNDNSVSSTDLKRTPSSPMPTPAAKLYTMKNSSIVNRSQGSLEKKRGNTAGPPLGVATMSTRGASKPLPNRIRKTSSNNRYSTLRKKLGEEEDVIGESKSDLNVSVGDDKEEKEKEEKEKEEEKKKWWEGLQRFVLCGSW